MSIEKKSLINSLKTTKKANFAGKSTKGQKQVSAMAVVSAKKNASMVKIG